MIYWSLVNEIWCHLIGDLGAAPDKVSLSGDGHKGPDVSIHGDRLVAVRVAEYDVGDPEFTNLTCYRVDLW